jgi:cell division septation protein DedD
MGSEDHEGQLEFFDVSNQAIGVSRPFSIGRVSVALRYDHLVVVGIAMLIASAVVFAFGVERGKSLARSERVVPLISMQTLAQTKPEAPKSASSDTPTAVAPGAKKGAEQGSATSVVPAATGRKAEPPKERASSKSRYAIQVVTYTHLRMARQEMERLESKGERVFLVTNQGRTKLYVGPFPSKANASEKLVGLRKRYQDCFVRSL